MAKLTELDLKALLASERSAALASSNADVLTNERTRALNYYQGDVSQDIPTVAGRSAVVSMDVADTVEGLMPSLMEIFAGSDDAVRFEPVGPEDTDAADQETEYVKHVFWNKNDGFRVLYYMIKDALMVKLGLAKVWWEENTDEEKETYYDKTPEEFAMIAMAPEVEIVEHSETQDQYGQTLHDITVVKKTTYGCAKVMAVPPEEFGIARRARTIADAHYCFHEPNGGRAVADLIAEGYDRKQVEALPTYNFPTETDKFARDTVAETNEPHGDDSINKAMRPVRITEHYIRMDYEGSGKAKLYRVVTGGEDSTVLRLNGKPDIQEWDFMPFAGITPIMMPHRVFGRSMADQVIDIQQQKTVMKRGWADNMYAVNMPRPEIAEDLSTDTTLDDLLVWRHGAPIRVKQPGAINWQGVPPVGQHVLPMLQYLDSEREWRTGVSRQGQGLDADALQNQTATAAQQLYNASQARMKMVARSFAETGIKDLFWLLHAVIRKNAKKSEIVRLTNKWVPIDPRNWRSRNDVTVTVGLGQGGKAERLQEMSMVGMYQEKAVLGGFKSLVQPKNLYNAARELCKIIEKDVELFFQDPGDEQIEDKPSPDEMKAKTELMKIQLEAQFKQKEMQGKAQIESLQAEADVATQDRKTQAEIALAERKFQFEAELKQQEFALERELKMLDLQAKAAQHEMDTRKMGMDMAKQERTHELDLEKAEMGLATTAEKHHMDTAVRADKHAQDSRMKAETHKQRMKEQAASAEPSGPISKTMKQLMEMQKQVLDAVESDREIEIKRDAKTGKAAGAVSRRKKPK